MSDHIHSTEPEVDSINLNSLALSDKKILIAVSPLPNNSNMLVALSNNKRLYPSSPNSNIINSPSQMTPPGAPLLHAMDPDQFSPMISTLIAMSNLSERNKNLIPTKISEKVEVQNERTDEKIRLLFPDVVQSLKESGTKFPRAIEVQSLEDDATNFPGKIKIHINSN